MPNLSGKWVVASFDGLNAMMDKFEVPQEKRDPAKLKGAVVEIAQDGDSFTITTTGGLGKSGSTSFTVGGPYESDLFGRTLKGTSSWEGEALVMKGEQGITLRREIVGGNLVYGLEFAGLKATITMNKA